MLHLKSSKHSERRKNLLREDKSTLKTHNQTTTTTTTTIEAMEHANIDNEDGQEQQAADARRRRRLELITVLQKTEEFPFQSKNKTDELGAELFSSPQYAVNNVLLLVVIMFIMPLFVYACYKINKNFESLDDEDLMGNW